MSKDSSKKKDIKYNNIIIPLSGYLNYINEAPSGKVKYAVINVPYGAQEKGQKQQKFSAAMFDNPEWLGSEISDALKDKASTIFMNATFSFSGIGTFEDKEEKIHHEIHGKLLSVDSIYINKTEVYKRKKQKAA
jgi:hypothetical protein